MKQVVKKVYLYTLYCEICNDIIEIPYTISDFGDAPILKKCKICNQLYWYTKDDEVYIQSLTDQLKGKKCEVCNSDLSKTLVDTHKNINCCRSYFSLDDDFAGKIIPPESEMVLVNVYLIYS